MAPSVPPALEFLHWLAATNHWNAVILDLLNDVAAVHALVNFNSITSSSFACLLCHAVTMFTRAGGKNARAARPMRAAVSGGPL